MADQVMCQHSGCVRAPARIMAMKFATMPGVFVAPYCEHHAADAEKSFGAEEACGPALSEAALGVSDGE